MFDIHVLINFKTQLGIKYPELSKTNKQQDPAEGLQVLLNELCTDEEVSITMIFLVTG